MYYNFRVEIRASDTFFMIGFSRTIVGFLLVLKSLPSYMHFFLNIIWRWNILVRMELKVKAKYSCDRVHTSLFLTFCWRFRPHPSNLHSLCLLPSACCLLSAAPSFPSSVPPHSFFTLTLTDHPEHLCPTSPLTWSDSQISGLHPLSLWFFCQMPRCFSLLIPMTLEVGHPWDINEPKYLSLLMEFVKSMSHAYILVKAVIELHFCTMHFKSLTTAWEMNIYIF